MMPQRSDNLTLKQSCHATKSALCCPFAIYREQQAYWIAQALELLSAKERAVKSRMCAC